MRRLSLLPALLLAGSLVGIASAPPAHAVPESDLVILSNQDGGCDNEHVVLLDTDTGAKAGSLGVPRKSAGAPQDIFGRLSDAKPVDNNKAVVAVWGGSDNGDPAYVGGVGLFDRSSSVNRWTVAFRFPADFKRGEGNVHSVAYRKGSVNQPDRYAVAIVGSIGGAGWGWVALFDANGVLLDKEQVSSAHGVEWDPVRGKFFVVGWDVVKSFALGGTLLNDLVPSTSYTIPSATPGGHDLRRRRSDNDYFVTTGHQSTSAVYRFAPDAPTKFTQLTKVGGAAIEPHIKSMDQGFDNETVYNQWPTPDQLYFLDGRTRTYSSCFKVYKARWIFAYGEKVYPEDPAPGSGGGGGGTGTYTPTIQVGANSNDWWIEVFVTPDDATSVDVMIDNGRFYMSLPRTSWKSWAASPPSAVLPTTPIKFLVHRGDASAATETFAYRTTSTPATRTGWTCPISLVAANEWWIEVSAPSATAVDAKVGNGAWTPLGKQSWGYWASTFHIPLGSDVVVRATDGNSTNGQLHYAYSQIWFNWPNP